MKKSLNLIALGALLSLCAIAAIGCNNTADEVSAPPTGAGAADTPEIAGTASGDSGMSSKDGASKPPPGGKTR